MAGILTDFRYKLATAIMPGVATAVRAGRLNYLVTGNSLTVLPPETMTYIKAYIENDQISAVQDWKSAKVAAAPPVLYKVVNKKSFRQYRDLSRKTDALSQVQAKAAKLQALEPVDKHPALDTLECPNPMQTRVELFHAIMTMLDVAGTTFIYGNRLSSGANKGQIRELWRLPEIGMQVEGIGLMTPPTLYRSATIREAIPADKVLMLRRFNPLSELHGNLYWGLSRLEPLRESVITKHKYANAVESINFQNGGQKDFVFPKGGNLDETSFEMGQQMTDDLNKKLRTKANVVGAAVELGNIKVGSPLGEMGVIESYDNMLEKVCAVYHIRKETMSSGKQSTYNNLSESRKVSLVDGVLPDQANLYDWLNRWFVASYNTDNETYWLEPDLDHYTELQEDQKTKVEVLSKLYLSENQRLEAMGWEKSTEPLMDVPMGPRDRVPITDFAAPDPSEEDPKPTGDYN
ncbi:hypothetical protein GCM10027299_21740 [Larkinella ripae]